MGWMNFNLYIRQCVEPFRSVFAAWEHLGMDAVAVDYAHFKIACVWCD